MPSKFDKLKTFLDNLGKNLDTIDFIMLSETFLNDSNEKFYKLKGYNMVTKNRKFKKGGGVCILYKRGN